jgi:hypothetical protein
LDPYWTWGRAVQAISRSDRGRWGTGSQGCRKRLPTALLQRILIRPGSLDYSGLRGEGSIPVPLPPPLHPSHQRDTAHRPIGTGRLRARRRFGYWGEQIGHLRDQSGHHFGARRQNSSLQPRVGVEKQLWKTLSLPVVRRLIAKEQHQGRGFESFPRYAFPLFPTPNYDFRRFPTFAGSG